MAKILIIDDDKYSRYALSEVIKYEGFEVEEAEDGIKGLDLLKNKEYDIIFCDIRMPKMDGIEVVEKLKSMDISTPVVMISAYSETETVVKVIKKGAFDFVSKPIDMNRFLVTLQNAFSYSKLTNEIKALKAKIKEVNEMADKTESITRIKEILNN